MKVQKVQKPATGPEKNTHTTVDTILFSKEELESWQVPLFQRPVAINEKVRALGEQIKADGGVLPGIITFGVIGGQTFLIDGQQRRAAFLLAGKEEGYADVRRCFFQNEGQMADEFVKLNSHLVNMRPDDILRGMEPSMPLLQELRATCPFIGYGQVRRGTTRSSLLSMSGVLRAWAISEKECPGSGICGKGVAMMARDLSDESVKHLASFLKLAHSAWGQDPEYYRLWSSLNLVMCMWLYRNVVLSSYSVKTQRLPSELYKKCLLGASAASDYLDFLGGRSLGERDRAPCYNKLKGIFARRIHEETGKKPLLPAPAWAHGH